MSEKTKKIIYWVLTGMVAFVFIGSALSKLTASPEALEMAQKFGLDKDSHFMLGIVELLIVILFVVPRTGVIGAFLLVAYMGGAIATHLEHGESLIAPCIIQAFVMAVTFYRFPQLLRTLLTSK